jgi:hypothetical protein
LYSGWFSNVQIKGFSTFCLRTNKHVQLKWQQISRDSVFVCSQDGQDYVHRIGRTGRAGRKGKAITLLRKGVNPNQTLESALRCILDWNVIVAQICALASPHLSPFALKFTAMSLRSRWASILTLVLKDFIWFALSFARIYCVFTGAFEIAGSEFHVHAPIASDCCGLASWYSVAEACHDLHHTGQTSRCMASLGSHNFWRYII